MRIIKESFLATFSRSLFWAVLLLASGLQAASPFPVIKTVELHPAKKLSWGFRNFNSTSEATSSCGSYIKDFDWELYRDTFLGIPKSPGNGVLSFEKHMFEMIYKTQLARPGNCYGMSLLSLLLYEKGGHLGFCAPPLQYSGDLTADCSYKADNGDNKATALGPASLKLRRAIEQMHGHQVHLPSVRHYFDLINNQGRIRDGNYAFSQAKKYKHAVISITSELSPGGGGHAMLAYATGEDQSKGEKYIYYYDPNYPWADDNYKDWYRMGYNKVVIWQDTLIWHWKVVRDWEPVWKDGAIIKYQKKTGGREWSGNTLSPKGGNIQIIPSSIAEPRSRTPASLNVQLGQIISQMRFSGDGTELVQATDGFGKMLYIPGTKIVDPEPATGMKTLCPFTPSGDGEGGPGIFFLMDDATGALDLDVAVGADGYRFCAAGPKGEIVVTAAGGGGTDRLRVKHLGTRGPAVVLMNTAGIAGYTVSMTQYLKRGRESRTFTASSVVIPPATPVELQVALNERALKVTSPAARIQFDLSISKTDAEQTMVLNMPEPVVVEAGEARTVGPESWSEMDAEHVWENEEVLGPEGIESYTQILYGEGDASERGFPDFTFARDVGEPAGGFTSYDDGSDSYSQGSEGAGTTAEGDQLQFVYRGIAGDFELTFELTGGSSPESAQAGLMVRRDCFPGAKFSYLESCRWSFRSRHGATGEPLHQQAFEPDPDREVKFLKLIRHGRTFYGFSSPDGSRWMPVGSNTWYELPEQSPVFAGFASAGLSEGEAVSFKVHQFSVIDPPLPGFVEDDGITEGTVMVSYDFDQPDGSEIDGFEVQVGSGAWLPQVQGSRLRICDESAADTAVSIFSADVVDGIDTAAYLFDFDLYFAREGEDNPAEGITFTLLNGAAGGQVGFSGDALGYGGLGYDFETGCNRSRNSLSVEFDVKRGEGENEGAGAPEEPGAWHVAINTQNSTDSVVHASDALPDLFSEEGIHVRILYNSGYAAVLLKGNSMPETDVLTKVLEAGLLPLTFAGADETAVFGFTAATGTDTVTAEVDNLVVTKVGCEDIQEEAIVEGAPTEPVDPGTAVILDGSGSHGGIGDENEPVTYLWSVIEGNAHIEGPDHGPTVTVRADGESTVKVQLTVDDGNCDNAASAAVTFAISDGSGIVNPFKRGDANSDGFIDLSDAVTVLAYLFAGMTPPPLCMDACDANDDGGVNIADAVGILSYLFGGAAPPPVPFPGCGTDPTPDSLDCGSYPPCL